MRIAIIGLGLIGGSLGLALKRARWHNAQITGFVRDFEKGSFAVRAGIIDTVATDMTDAVREADLVIIATPVLVMRNVFSQIAPHLSPTCIVTDVASTKALIMQWAEELLPPYVCFIGGHPMAGKETSGIQAVQADLFNHCTYCLVKGRSTNPEGLVLMHDMIKALNAQSLIINADEHDNLVAAISHLPLLLSTALTLTTTKDQAWEQMAQLAATGYRDVTRLASGSPDMHTQICLSNREAIVFWINKFMKELQGLRALVEKGSTDLEKSFETACEERNKWLKKRS